MSTLTWKERSPKFFKCIFHSFFTQYMQKIYHLYLLLVLLHVFWFWNLEFVSCFLKNDQMYLYFQCFFSICRLISAGLSMAFLKIFFGLVRSVLYIKIFFFETKMKLCHQLFLLLVLIFFSKISVNWVICLRLKISEQLFFPFFVERCFNFPHELDPYVVFVGLCIIFGFQSVQRFVFFK